KKTTLPAIAGDGSDVEEDKDILNVIISASNALRYAKRLKAYIQQQSKFEISLSFLNELTSLEKNLAVQEKNKRRLIDFLIRLSFNSCQSYHFFLYNFN